MLDQGYWPDGLYTAPSDEALIYDIRAMKDLGFNMLRKHGKIETDRWYFHCDRMGMLVWQDMPNGGSSYHHWFVTYLATLLNWMRIPVKRPPRPPALAQMNSAARNTLTISGIWSGHCIIILPLSHGYHLTKDGDNFPQKVTDFIHRLDPSRLVDSASGWFDQGCGDINSLHYYFLGLQYQNQTVYLLYLNLEVTLFACQSTVPVETFTDIRNLPPARRLPTASPG